MRKFMTIALSLLLLGVLLVGITQPVSAAGTAHMSISSGSGTVYRGDTFTLTVSLSNDQPVSNGAVILSYDSSAFELVGGKCNVSNATVEQVSAANGGGTFALQTDAVVSGTIFTMEMRVKGDAPFGNYSISGFPSLNIPCSISGTSVRIACNHAFENCTKVDGSNHESTCSICGEKKTDAHTWDGGTVTKAPTCKDTGSKKLKCTGCGATKDETVPVTDDHKYGSWSKTSDSRHSRSCSICGKTDGASHNWDSKKVIEKATCQSTGSQKLTCSACGATKTETIPKAAHDYGDAAYVDDTNHKQICANCDEEKTSAHDYGDQFAHDANWHFRRCTGCGHEKEQAAHVPGPKATETTDQICTVCGRILQPKGEHIHSFEEAWSVDETGHWHACSDCNEKDSAGLHEFDSECDADCNVCAMTREPAHTPGQDWSMDATGHWYTCQDCGEKVGFAPHTPGPEATIAAAQVCTLCQYEIAPVVPHDHVFDEQGTLHRHTCACGEIYEAELGECEICVQFPWWIVCIAEAVIFGGILLWLLPGWKIRRYKRRQIRRNDP